MNDGGKCTTSVAAVVTALIVVWRYGRSRYTNRQDILARCHTCEPAWYDSVPNVGSMATRPPETLAVPYCVSRYHFLP
jgi:hypothetical protein